MLQKIEVKPNSPEWFKLREEGIGCSDISVLTGESEFSNPIRLFYQKLGMYPMESRPNELSFWGHSQEPVILDHWQYWDRTDKVKYMEHYKHGNIQRTYKKNTGFILINDDYPFMFFTPDGIIPAGETDLEGNVLDKDCPMNAKNINHMVYNMYGGIAPYIIEQMHGEMIVMGVQYSEVPHLVGGCQFHVDSCPYSEVVATSILEVCRSFWYDKVVPAKPLAKKFLAATATKEKEAIMKDLHQLEPPPDDTEKYRQFIAERFVNRNLKVQASGEMEVLMHAYEHLKDYKNSIERTQKTISNLLLRYHEHNGVTRIICKDDSFYSSYNKKHIIEGDVNNIQGKQIAQAEIKQLIN